MTLKTIDSSQNTSFFQLFFLLGITLPPLYFSYLWRWGLNLNLIAIRRVTIHISDLKNCGFNIIFGHFQLTLDLIAIRSVNIHISDLKKLWIQHYFWPFSITFIPNARDTLK